MTRIKMESESGERVRKRALRRYESSAGAELDALPPPDPGQNSGCIPEAPQSPEQAPPCAANETAADSRLEIPPTAGEVWVTTRLCSRCGKRLPRTPRYWHLDKKCAGGLSTICKACRREHERQRRMVQRAGDLRELRERNLHPPGELPAREIGRPVDAAAAAGGCLPEAEGIVTTVVPPTGYVSDYLATTEDGEIAILSLDCSGYPQVIQALRDKAAREIRTPVEQALWELRQALCGGGAA